MHVDCSARVRLVTTTSDGTVLERLRGMQHSNEIEEYDRANAALTRAQKHSFCEAKRYGGTSSNIMKNHQMAELAKPGGKRKSDDTGVEGVKVGLVVLH